MTEPPNPFSREGAADPQRPQPGAGEPSNAGPGETWPSYPGSVPRSFGYDPNDIPAYGGQPGAAPAPSDPTNPYQTSYPSVGPPHGSTPDANLPYSTSPYTNPPYGTSPYGPSAYALSPYGYTPTTHPQAVPSLVLGIIGLVICPWVGIAAFVWVWILGTACYYLIPSLGPFHFDPEVFAGLPQTGIQATQALYLEQREHLLANPHAPDAFAQVSAFASLHVGVTATVLGLAWWHRRRRTTAVLAVFLAGTMLATVYLGWHFAVDVPAGLAIATLAWWLAPRTVGAGRRTPVRRRASTG